MLFVLLHDTEGMVNFFDNRLAIAVSPDPCYRLANIQSNKIKEIRPPPTVAYPSGPSPEDDNLRDWECLSDLSRPGHRTENKELKRFLYRQAKADLLRKTIRINDRD